MRSDKTDYVKILPLGHVSSVKGDFLVDTESFQLMRNTMHRRNIDIVIDYEHQTLDNVQAPAGGWIKDLILKNDGVYAIVEWTQRAKEYLKNKEYRYLSPVVLVRPEDKKVTQLHSVALTNTPAINGMIPIVNSVSLKQMKPVQNDSETNHIYEMLCLSKQDIEKYGKN